MMYLPAIVLIPSTYMSSESSAAVDAVALVAAVVADVPFFNGHLRQMHSRVEQSNVTLDP